ncbi:MAG: cupin domain-containing protein [Chloroflexi bacterium]|nr:cupin domain-containing protein [Chloroflexota bacterium]
MSLDLASQAIHYSDLKEQVAFSDLGPNPQFLVDSEHFKVVLAGLESGQAIPSHPESMAIYYFIEGEGVMTVNDQEFPVQSGSAIITLAGAHRGLRAHTRLIFLAAKSV